MTDSSNSHIESKGQSLTKRKILTILGLLLAGLFLVTTIVPALSTRKQGTMVKMARQLSGIQTGLMYYQAQTRHTITDIRHLLDIYPQDFTERIFQHPQTKVPLTIHYFPEAKHGVTLATPYRERYIVIFQDGHMEVIDDSDRIAKLINPVDAEHGE